MKTPILSIEGLQGEKGEKSRGGGIGRREGLKIPWVVIPCGFESRPRHQVPSLLSHSFCHHVLWDADKGFPVQGIDICPGFGYPLSRVGIKCLVRG